MRHHTTPHSGSGSVGGYMYVGSVGWRICGWSSSSRKYTPPPPSRQASVDHQSTIVKQLTLYARRCRWMELHYGLSHPGRMTRGGPSLKSWPRARASGGMLPCSMPDRRRLGDCCAVEAEGATSWSAPCVHRWGAGHGGELRRCLLGLGLEHRVVVVVVISCRLLNRRRYARNA